MFEAEQSNKTHNVTNSYSFISFLESRFIKFSFFWTRIEATAVSLTKVM